MSEVRSRECQEVAMQGEAHEFKIFELTDSKVDNCLKLSLATSKTNSRSFWDGDAKWVMFASSDPDVFFFAMR